MKMYLIGNRLHSAYQSMTTVMLTDPKKYDQGVIIDPCRETYSLKLTHPKYQQQLLYRHTNSSINAQKDASAHRGFLPWPKHNESDVINVYQIN